MMKLIVSLLVAAALVVPLGFAQTPPDLATEARRATSVPEPVIVPFSVGTVFNAILISPLDARRNKAGDPVTAEVSEVVTYERSVIFPKGTRIYGHLARASSARSGKGSALFVQFDKAVLKNGQEVMMNAGIQALVAGRRPVSGDADQGMEGDLSHSQSFPSSQTSDADEFSPRDVSTPAVVPASHELQSPAGSRNNGAAANQGAVTKGGMLTPDSQGALGASDLKVYTPLSEGSNGTVLLSSTKNVHLEAGTKLLIVIQPPPEADPSLQ
ncbi:MAG: hypothetical protein M3N22_03650 [Acidobacteriota bacterium]|nr:hypothetical protein [Acidobacteriota bacterium]